MKDTVSTAKNKIVIKKTKTPLTWDKVKNILTLTLLYAALTLIAILVIYPIIWIIGSSFNTGDSLMSSSMIPKDPSIIQYKKLLTKTNYPLWYWNTLKIAVMNVVVSVILTICMAYPFSRFKFAGRKYGMIAMLVLQMFPPFMGMIAIYVLLLQIGLLNTHMGLILVYAGAQIPFNTWLVKGYLDTIPRSLDEAAKLDGASNTTIFMKIILPLAQPIMTYVALQNFISPMMDFIFPRLILRSDDKKTLAVGLFEMIRGQSQNKFTQFAAGAVLIAIPITILFMFLQKYLIEGLTAGANKG